MKKIIIDGNEMTSVKKVHEFLKDALDFPDYYGENLDALWDVLTDIVDPVEICLINKDKFREHLGPDADGFIDVFKYVQSEYGCVRLKIY